MGKSSKRTLDQATASDAAAPAAMEVDSAAPPAVASPTKKSKKDKKDKSGAAATADGDDKEVGLEQLAEIAKPLAVKKTGKHVLRLVKKGESLASGHTPRRACRTFSIYCCKVYACLYEPADPGEGVVSPPFTTPRLTSCTAPSKPASKSRHLKRGVKEVVKSIRKGEKGCVTRLRERTVPHTGTETVFALQHRCFGCRHLASRHSHPHSSARGRGKLPLHRMFTLPHSSEERSPDVDTENATPAVGHLEGVSRSRLFDQATDILRHGRREGHEAESGQGRRGGQG